MANGVPTYGAVRTVLQRTSCGRRRCRASSMWRRMSLCDSCNSMFGTAIARRMLCFSSRKGGPLSVTIHKMSTFPVRRSEKFGMDDPLAIVITIWNTMATWRRAPDKEAGDTLVLMFGIRRLKKWLAHQVHSDGVSSRLLLPSASQKISSMSQAE